MSEYYPPPPIAPWTADSSATPPPPPPPRPVHHSYPPRHDAQPNYVQSGPGYSHPYTTSFYSYSSPSSGQDPVAPPAPYRPPPPPPPAPPPPPGTAYSSQGAHPQPHASAYTPSTPSYNGPQPPNGPAQTASQSWHTHYPLPPLNRPPQYQNGPVHYIPPTPAYSSAHTNTNITSQTHLHPPPPAVQYVPGQLPQYQPQYANAHANTNYPPQPPRAQAPPSYQTGVAVAYPPQPPVNRPQSNEQENGPAHHPPPAPSPTARPVQAPDATPGHNHYASPPTTPQNQRQVQQQQRPAALPHRESPFAAIQDTVAGLAANLNGLSIGSGASNPVSPATSRLGNDSPRPPPPMRANGIPNEVLNYCPEDRVVDYSLWWYQLPDVPNFLICTKCHCEHIQNTSLASHFKRVKRADHAPSSCYFWHSRMVEILWPQALRSGSLDTLRDFMRKRVDIKSCKGQAGVAASEGIKWFCMTNHEIAGFISCEACYEDRIAGTAFEPRFTAFQEQKQDEKWSCDVCIPFISRSIGKRARQNDWSGFVSSATHRFRLPACEGKEMQSNSCRWYIPRHQIQGLVVCEACYLDKLALKRFENQFELHSPSIDLDSFITQFTTTLWTCKLTSSNLPMAFALECALERRDWSVFRDAAAAICRLVPCTANGIICGNWWTLRGGCANFDVCEACYIGILQAGRTAQFFEPAQRNREETLVCDFCIASPRFLQYLGKYAQALDTGVFSPYAEFVKTFASVPVCPGLKTREKTEWWGYPEALFCQDCYLSFVAGTALGRSVPIKGEYDERAQICQIWSPRMRTMWARVCGAGAPGSSESNKALAEFKGFGEKRLQVYVNTIPQMEFIRAMKEMKMKNAMHQGLLSVMYNGMDGLAQVSGTTDGNLHGNSQLGWYATEQGATGAQMFNNMQAGFANANRVDEWMQMAQLEMVWKQVE